MRRAAHIMRGELGGSRWELAVRAPSPRLLPYTGSLMGYDERTAAPLRRRELPGPRVVLIFEIGPPIRVISSTGDERFAGGFAAGLHDAHTVCDHDGHQRGIQVDLTPLGARRLFGRPMSELTSRVVSLRDLLPREHASLCERLATLRTWDARLDLVEGLLATRIESSSIDLRVTTWALRRIEERGGAIDIRALARELGYSHEHVIRTFRDHVGIPPKLFARIVRFDRLVKRIKAGGDVRWPALAQDLGYYDQSHLVRDVKQFTGLTPTEARGEIVDLAALVST
ncbi:helix-turn-helix domain-containing protein [Sandaracinus amylolyticus]|uniref:helix-turn-helix domain-containing protein n=1 Tax=Sandaracinus amylolyticus TaxID=927083 RepID=UPI001F26CC46|nr:helix-turn-helix domain-containing protein [Sandaracinus amylolyticus]